MILKIIIYYGEGCGENYYFLFLSNVRDASDPFYICTTQHYFFTDNMTKLFFFFFKKEIHKAQGI